MANFLLEIGVEEIPDWMIPPALAELHKRFADAFAAFGGSSITTDATPRRLVLQAKDLIGQAPDVETLVQGPYLSAGEKAAEGFAKKQNTTIDKLSKMTDAKGERYISNQLVKGQVAVHALAEKLPGVITSIPFPKTMYWTGKGGVKFIRPIRWIVALLDDQIIPFEIAGVKSGNITRGHRILGSKGPLLVGINTYAQALRANFVIVSADERKARIEKALGPDVQKDEALLKTLVYLTEFPTPIRGSFDKSYLELPKEILSTVMRHHQRYFSVLNADGSLAPEFVAVTNTDGDPDGLIRQGNEKVLKARFNDARFFWETDQKIPLRDRVEMLKSVTFQKDLGSYYDKTLRVQKLGSLIAETIRSAGSAARPGIIFKAALLCKTDLTTELVKEFTELQGIIGGLYARAQELDPILPASTVEAIADAIYDHYKPESMDDSIPRSVEGGVLAIADKADSIAGMFALGLQPTGSKDPFALRRAANGIVKIIAEQKLPLPISKLFADARVEYTGSEAERRFKHDFDFGDAVGKFMRERLEFYLRDARGFAYDVVNAVLAAGSDDVVDAIVRAEAVSDVRGSEDFASISVAFKRIKNILRQARETKKSIAEQLDPAALADEAEKHLATAIPGTALAVRQLREEKKYASALAQVSRLRQPVDAFFDKVMVMVDDERVRANRLALLRDLLSEFSTIADFSEIVTEGK